MIKPLVIAAAMLTSAMAPAPVNSDLEEIIVTGSRNFDYEPDFIPAVRLIKRADFMIQKLRIENDSRKEEMRASEIYATIAAMLKKAKASKDFTLGTGDDHFVPLTEDNYQLPLQKGKREDTNITYLLVKAPLTAGVSANAIAGSIRKFIKDIKPNGRTEVSPDGDLGLSIVRPERYRYDLISAIADDSKKTAAAFGPGYHVRITGIEYPLLWERQGLDTMALYIPYKVEIVPPASTR